MQPFVLALVVHGLIGGADVSINHELIARIPSQPGSALEERLHSARELIFALLFSALAWFEWRGWLAAVIAMLLLAELAVSTVDTVVELDKRTLPVTERVAHVLLFVNLGIIFALPGQQLLAWVRLPAALAATSHGAMSGVLSVLAALALGWSIRDSLAAARNRLLARAASA